MKIHPFRVWSAIILSLLALAAAPLVRAQAAAPPEDTAPLATPPASSQRPPSSNKWRIVFDERAKSDGLISLRIWPAGAAPVQVDVAIARHQAENSIAASVRDALSGRLGSGFHVEVDDGEDVLLKARHGTPDFGLELVGNTAEDVDIRLRRE